MQAGRARALARLGQHERVLELCRAALEGLSRPFETGGVAIVVLQVEQALAEAHLGELESAAERLDALVTEHAPTENPLAMAMIHEARARVAILQGDTVLALHHTHKMENWVRPTKNPALIARYDALAAEVARGPKRATESARLAREDYDALEMQVVAGRDPRERAETTLRILLERTGGSEGFFFAVWPAGVRCLAPEGAAAPLKLEAAVAGLVRRMTQAGNEGEETETATTDSKRSSSKVEGARDRFRILPLCARRGDGLRLAAVVALVPSESFRAADVELCSALARGLCEGDMLDTLPLGKGAQGLA